MGLTLPLQKVFVFCARRSLLVPDIPSLGPNCFQAMAQCGTSAFDGVRTILCGQCQLMCKPTVFFVIGQRIKNHLLAIDICCIFNCLSLA